MSDQAEQRRRRLAQLLDLAQTYKGWTRKQLATTLGRDPTKLIPGSGVPKLDLVVDLATVLDWPVGVVVGCLWNEEDAPEGNTKVEPSADFEALDGAARQAHRNGQYALMVEIGRQMYAAARLPEERARACNRQAGGWDGLGRYSNLLEAVQRGLRERPIKGEFRRQLQCNLANAYYTLWSLTEASSIAQGTVQWFKENPPTTVRSRKTRSFAHYVSGHTFRRLMGQDPENATTHGFRGKEHLETCIQLYTALAKETGNDSLAGIANTCRGGIMEIEVELGQRDAVDAIDHLVEGLDAVVDTEHGLVGDWLESYGWWCIFGCNIALRRLTDDRQLQHYMAIFTNKADEIADRLDNWSMRERAFTMQYTRWKRAVDATGFEIPNVVDQEDVRLITGTMGRFPTFRETGWQILKTAQVVRSN